jgi:hypothetical protein
MELDVKTTLCLARDTSAVLTKKSIHEKFKKKSFYLFAPYFYLKKKMLLRLFIDNNVLNYKIKKIHRK